MVVTHSGAWTITSATALRGTRSHYTQLTPEPSTTYMSFGFGMTSKRYRGAGEVCPRVSEVRFDGCSPPAEAAILPLAPTASETDHCHRKTPTGTRPRNESDTVIASPKYNLTRIRTQLPRKGVSKQADRVYKASSGGTDSHLTTPSSPPGLKLRSDGQPFASLFISLVRYPETSTGNFDASERHLLTRSHPAATTRARWRWSRQDRGHPTARSHNCFDFRYHG